MDKVSVYCLDPLNLRCNYQYKCLASHYAKQASFTKLVLYYEIFKKWTASKPIS